MNRQALFVCLIALALTIVAGSAAQGACYRGSIAYVSGPMNIRQSQSTNSPVVRKAAAGDSFPVSSSTQGSRYCWLDIPPGWMAWTLRVSANPPGGTTAPAAEQATQPPNIDNCCFVNRQCQTDREWVNGYWAFQRNECPVSTTTTEPTTSQPITQTRSQVDNCCFTGWQCSGDDEWVRGYWAYRNNQCEAGHPRSSSIRHGNLIIEGSETFQIWVNDGLDLLRRRAPQWYNYVLNATRKVKERPAESGAFVITASATHHTAWDPNHYPNHLNIFTIAHEMVHEACHIYQHRRGDSREQVHQEKECIEKEIELFPLIDREGRYLGRMESWRHTAANMLHDSSLWWW